MAKARDPETVDPVLGYHKGLPILGRSFTIQNGARSVTQTGQFFPMDVEANGDLVMSTHFHQTKETFVNVLSKDDPEKLMGYERVITLDMIGAIPDERPEVIEELRAHEQAIVDKAEEEKQAKSGQPRIPYEAALPASGEISELKDELIGDAVEALTEEIVAAAVSEVRDGVPDDWGDSEAAQFLAPDDNDD